MISILNKNFENVVSFLLKIVSCIYISAVKQLIVINRI